MTTSNRISVQMEELPEVERSAPKKVDEDNDHLNIEDSKHGCCGYVLIILCALLFIITIPISIFFALRVIRTYERGVVLRLGKLVKYGGSRVMGAGVQFLLPLADKLMKVDLRTQTVNIKPQDVLTSDAVTVGVDAVAFLRVIEPAAAILRVENARRSSELLAISSLRSVIGSYDLSVLLNQRSKLDEKLKEILDEGTKHWGIKVSHLKDRLT